jgi:hypothetical protein
MECAIEREMAMRLGKDLATAEQEGYAIRGRVVARGASMFEAVLDSVAAKEEAVDEFAQLNRYRQKVWSAHGDDTGVAPADVFERRSAKFLGFRETESCQTSC